MQTGNATPPPRRSATPTGSATPRHSPMRTGNVIQRRYPTPTGEQLQPPFLLLFSVIPRKLFVHPLLLDSSSACWYKACCREQEGGRTFQMLPFNCEGEGDCCFLGSICAGRPFTPLSRFLIDTDNQHPSEIRLSSLLSCAPSTLLRILKRTPFPRLSDPSTLPSPFRPDPNQLTPTHPPIEPDCPQR